MEQKTTEKMAKIEDELIEQTQNIQRIKQGLQEASQHIMPEL